MTENTEKKENSSNPAESQKTDFTQVVSDKALNILDGFISLMDKQVKEQKTDTIIEKAKVSKKSEKVSKERIQTTPEIKISIDKSSLANQYTDNIMIGLDLLNPFLALKFGIEPFTRDEIFDLVNAIVDLFESNIKEAVEKIESNISFMKSLRKIIKLIKAVWNLFAPRITIIRKKLLEIKAKREVEKLEKLAKEKVQIAK